MNDLMFETMDLFNQCQMIRNERYDEAIKLLSDSMIEVMEEVEKQNEAIRELQKIVYGKKEES